MAELGLPGCVCHRSTRHSEAVCHLMVGSTWVPSWDFVTLRISISRFTRHKESVFNKTDERGDLFVRLSVCKKMGNRMHCHCASFWFYSKTILGKWCVLCCIQSIHWLAFPSCASGPTIILPKPHKALGSVGFTAAPSPSLISYTAVVDSSC